MPPKGSASPAHPSGSSPGDETQDELFTALRTHQQKTTRAYLKKQQAVLTQAEKVIEEYKEEVKNCLKEEEEAIQKRVAKYKAEDARLKKEIAETEKELLEVLQVEASTIQLSAAAVQADIEDSKADQTAIVERLEKLAHEEAKGIGQAVEGLWQPAVEESGERQPMQEEQGQA
ncbi:hypothetical protein JCM11641_002762 [Rhodosporidiobolus odoratus]